MRRMFNPSMTTMLPLRSSEALRFSERCHYNVPSELLNSETRWMEWNTAIECNRTNVCYVIRPVRRCFLQGHSKMKRWELIRDGAIVAGMVACSFLAGWWAYGHDFSKSRHIAFDFSKPYLIPRDRESIGIKATPDTASFGVGDRIDIFVQLDDSLEPLIVDAVVTHQQKTSFGMLLPYGGRDLLAYARENGLRLVYRFSNATTDPINLEQSRPGATQSQNDG
jgi:hypothetical protein